MVFYFAKSTIKYGLKVFFDIMGSPYLDNKKKYQVQSNKKNSIWNDQIEKKNNWGTKKIEGWISPLTMQFFP
jgi:hypothetical protein